MYNENYDSVDEKSLIGVKVTGLDRPFTQGDESITFLTEKGKFTLSCDGDCCSRSWFEHMELPEFPFNITNAEEVDGKDVLQPDSEWEVIKTYGFKMTTDKGHVDIDMRNSSNGYYGGSFYLDLHDLE